MNIQKSLSTKTQLHPDQQLFTSIPLDPTFLASYMPSVKFSTTDSSLLRLTLKKLNSCLNESKSTLTLAEVKFQELFFKNKNLLFESITDTTTIRNNTFNTNQNNNINETETNSNNNENIKKWYLLINVISTLIRLSKIKTQQINLDSIDDYLPTSPSNKNINKQKKHKDKNNNNDNNNEGHLPKINCYLACKTHSKSNSSSTASLGPLEVVNDQLELFYYLSNGLEDKEKEIIKILNKRHFINERGYGGNTPLYVACSNGHWKLAKLLLDKGADHLLLCGLEEEESVLDVAARLNYVNVVEGLLKQCKWPETFIKRSLAIVREHNNKGMEKIIKKYSSKKIRTFCGCFQFSCMKHKNN